MFSEKNEHFQPNILTDFEINSLTQFKHSVFSCCLKNSDCKHLKELLIRKYNSVFRENRCRPNIQTIIWCTKIKLTCKFGNIQVNVAVDNMHTSSVLLKCCDLSPAVTLKIRSRSVVTLKIRSISLELNQLFIVSQCYIHANWVKFRQPFREISDKKLSITL